MRLKRLFETLRPKHRRSDLCVAMYCSTFGTDPSTAKRDEQAGSNHVQ
ncbi:hypothetical protein [Haladaptatus sp. DYSN1]|nr:hypothetical protein [Haladaptatus sp. DYSN1]